MKKLHIFTSQQGTSLMELMIVAGIASIISLGSISLITSQQQGVRVIEDRLARTDLNQEIVLAVSNSTPIPNYNCGLDLAGGVEFGSEIKIMNLNLTDIKYSTDPTDSKNQYAGIFNIDNIRLLNRPLDPVGIGETKTADLEIVVSRIANRNGPPLRSITVPVQVTAHATADPVRVISCTRASASALEVTDPSQAYLEGLQHQGFQCTALGGSLVNVPAPSLDGSEVMICKFPRSECPVGWGRFRNWSTAKNNTENFIPMWRMVHQHSCKPVPILNKVPCSASGHDWGDIPLNSKTCDIGTSTCKGKGYHRTTYAIITEIGCF